MVINLERINKLINLEYSYEVKLRYVLLLSLIKTFVRSGNMYIH